MSDLFETEPRLAQTQSIGRQLVKELEPCRSLPGVLDVRVMGAIGVVELARLENPAALRQAFLKFGVWIRPFRNIVYVTPALTIAPADLSRLTGAIVQVLSEGKSVAA